MNSRPALQHNRPRTAERGPLGAEDGGIRRDDVCNEAERRPKPPKKSLERMPFSFFGPCNALKFHKTAKAFFGKAWTKTCWIWKSLQESLGTAFIPPLPASRDAPRRSRTGAWPAR